MSYMLLIVEPLGQRQERTEAEGRALYEREAVRVRMNGGKATLTDGPFVESKEMVGGFYLLTCKTREEAVEIAKQCPAAEWAMVEVRELAPCYL